MKNLGMNLPEQIEKHIKRVWGINFYLLRTFCPQLGSFLCCFFFHYISAKFHHWPSSGDLPRPRIGMLSLVTVSPVITAFHSCCLSHQTTQKTTKMRTKSS